MRIPAPDITDPADAIIKNTSCTICGSDLHMSALSSPVCITSSTVCDCYMEPTNLFHSLDVLLRYFNKVPSKAGAPLSAGCILGHEAMGIVDKIGPEVKNLKVGDRVVISAPISCGSCDYCKRGQFSLCEASNPSEATELMYGHRMGGMCNQTFSYQLACCRTKIFVHSFTALPAAF